ncbi:MAG: hypothetical protein ABSE16_13720 [Verrucomicrobiota bacterium]
MEKAVWAYGVNEARRLNELELEINEFLAQHPDLRLLATHMSTLVTPAEPNAMPKTEESAIIIFCTLFYDGHE